MKNAVFILFFLLCCSCQQNREQHILSLNEKLTNYLSTLDNNNLLSLYKATNYLKELGDSIEQPLPDKIVDQYLSFAFHNSVHLSANIKRIYKEPQFEKHSWNEAFQPELILPYKKHLASKYYTQRIDRCNHLELQPDLSIIQRELSSHLSNPMKRYLHILAAQTEFPLDDCERMDVKPQELVDRVVELENFMKDNQDFIYQQKCEILKKAYSSALLQGNDRNFVLTQKGHFSDYFRTAYEYLTQTYPNSEILKIVIPWFEMLKEYDYLSFRKMWKLYEANGWLHITPPCCGMC